MHSGTADTVKRETGLAILAYVLQIPIVTASSAGLLPLHPIAIVLPMVGLLNSRVERKGLEGLGLTCCHPVRSCLLGLLGAGMLFGGNWWLLREEGMHSVGFPLSNANMLALAQDLAIDVFIIALWEEIASRGYIQTRLQAVWGFWGVVVASLMFGSLHVPSGVLIHGFGAADAVLHFVRMSLGGLILGLVYWRTGTVVTTIVVHGLRNFAMSLSMRLWDSGAAYLHSFRGLDQTAWLMVELALTWFLCRMLFPTQAERAGA